jgi:hypothetical protein
VGIEGVLMRLLARFVGSEMISFAVSGGAGAVGVCRKIMQLMVALWHSVLLAVKGYELVGLNSVFAL